MINAFSGISARQSYQQTGGGGGGNGTTLLEWSDLTYEGSFRVPYSYPSNTYADYGGYGGMWFDPSGNGGSGSLWLTGHNSFLTWLEISIPTLTDLSGATAISAANTGTLLQGRTIARNDIPNPSLNENESLKTGFIFLDNGKMYAGLYEYYDGSGDANRNCIYFDSTTLSGATIYGEFRIGSTAIKPASLAQNVGDIPAAKQSKLGGYTHFGTTIAGPIISRYSAGPSFVPFDPTDIGVTAPSDASLYMFRDINTDGEAVNYDRLSFIGGACIPDGTNCIIYYGCKVADGDVQVYGDAQQGDPEDPFGDPVWINDTNRGGKGYHAQQGNYAFCYWAYDLDDLEAVKNGTLGANAVAPYAYGDITLPKQNGEKIPGGMAYDRTNKKIYLCVTKTDNGEFSRLPLIHCYSHA